MLTKPAAGAIAFSTVMAQPAGPDWKALEPEMMQQFQAILRFDTRNPPGKIGRAQRLNSSHRSLSRMPSSA